MHRTGDYSSKPAAEQKADEKSWLKLHSSMKAQKRDPSEAFADALDSGEMSRHSSHPHFFAAYAYVATDYRGHIFRDLRTRAGYLVPVTDRAAVA